jgi:hypothetical protein
MSFTSLATICRSGNKYSCSSRISLAFAASWDDPMIFARQRIIHLTEGLEETIPLVIGNPNTSIYDLKMNQIIGVRRNMNRNLPRSVNFIAFSSR